MSAKTPENVIISAINGALAKYPEGGWWCAFGLPMDAA
jgi:hypothetical protein